MSFDTLPGSASRMHVELLGIASKFYKHSQSLADDNHGIQIPISQNTFL